MGGMEHIRKRYNVPARRGGRIRFLGRDIGTIVAARHGRLRVRFEQQKYIAFLHPTWEVEYLPNAPDQARLQPSPEAGGSASELTSQPERPLADRYNELLYAVARKFPGESRHETALRYIRQMEEVHAGPCMQNAGAVPRRGSDVGTSHLLAVSGSGEK
jgi:hypothetical protein